MVKKVPGGRGGTLHILEKGETANPNGRPKRTVSVINTELKEKGFTPVTTQDIQDAYLQIINLDDEELDNLKRDSSKMPLLYKIILKHLGKNKGYDVLEKMLDRSLGKATQKIEQTVTGDLKIKVPE